VDRSPDLLDSDSNAQTAVAWSHPAGGVSVVAPSPGTFPDGACGTLAYHGGGDLSLDRQPFVIRANSQPRGTGAAAY